MEHSKHFTLEEASSLLIEIRENMKTIVELKKDIDKLGLNIYRHHFFSGQEPNGVKYHSKELELIAIIKDIAGKGVLVKGLDNGLIDFPSIRQNGEEVYLCWHLEEDNINYWHRIQDGFTGRRPIQEY
ncbi:DUF2203 domain-containing protein [candidate division KSB1 bacterium]|nr:DUF2203 domain-containing protein [candidate division KSB1 bacterium]